MERDRRLEGPRQGRSGEKSPGRPMGGTIAMTWVNVRLRRFLGSALLAVAALTLSACHIDLTYSVDLHPNHTATVGVRETYDDQVYQLAQSTGKADPLGIGIARKAGWRVTAKVDPSGNHVITMTRVVPSAQLDGALAGALHVVAAQVSFPNEPQRPKLTWTQSGGIFDTLDHVRMRFPAPMPSNDEVDTEMAESVVSVRLKMRAPGSLVTTNGTMEPNGFVVWTIPPDRATVIRYETRSVNVRAYVIIVLCVSLLLAFAAIAIVRMRASRAIATTPAQKGDSTS